MCAAKKDETMSTGFPEYDPKTYTSIADQMAAIEKATLPLRFIKGVEISDPDEQFTSWGEIPAAGFDQLIGQTSTFISNLSKQVAEKADAAITAAIKAKFPETKDFNEAEMFEWVKAHRHELVIEHHPVQTAGEVGDDDFKMVMPIEVRTRDEVKADSRPLLVSGDEGELVPWDYSEPKPFGIGYFTDKRLILSPNERDFLLANGVNLGNEGEHYYLSEELSDDAVVSFDPKTGSAEYVKTNAAALSADDILTSIASAVGKLAQKGSPLTESKVRDSIPTVDHLKAWVVSEFKDGRWVIDCGMFAVKSDAYKLQKKLIKQHPAADAVEQTEYLIVRVRLDQYLLDIAQNADNWRKARPLAPDAVIKL